jgi:transposase
MAEPARARRLSDLEGQRLQQIVRRGKHGPVRVRRAVIIMASAPGTLVPAIARLVAADEDTVRDVIHLSSQKGLAALDPQRAGGRPRLISDSDVAVIVTAATTGPEKLGQPFTHWSLRKLAAHFAGRDDPVAVGRERLRQILCERGISFPRTRTWKESADPGKDAKLDRIEYVTSHYPGRCFVFDQFGPLSIRPCHGNCWAPRKHPARQRATYHRTHGIRYIRRWARREIVELCLTPTSASWANPIEAQSGPLRTFVMGGSDHPEAYRAAAPCSLMPLPQPFVHSSAACRTRWCGLS